jgi:hypothetical protein
MSSQRKSKPVIGDTSIKSKPKPKTTTTLETTPRQQRIQSMKSSNTNTKSVPKPKFNLKRKAARALPKFGATAQPSLFDKCKHIATSQDILADFAASIKEYGQVGEEQNAKLLYLSVSSAVTRHPVPVVVVGESAGGKSKLVSRVLHHFPSSAYSEFTAVSEKALIHWNEPVKHKVLVFYEYDALKSEQINYLVRSLISEGAFRYLTTVPAEGGGHTAKYIVKEGPTGVITTTTGELHWENATRTLSLQIDESSETTIGVIKGLERTKRKHADNSGLKAWRTFHKWFAKQPKEVDIPFWEDISDLIPPNAAVRLRRDFGSIQQLIEVHALLHRKNRKSTDDGVLIAERRDYVAVRKLLKVLVAEAVQSTVPKIVRETVEAVVALNKRAITATELAEKLGIDVGNASRRIKAPIKLGYLVNKESRRGHPLKIALGEPLPDDQEILPSAKRVREHYAARMAKLEVRAKVKTKGPKTNRALVEHRA